MYESATRVPGKHVEEGSLTTVACLARGQVIEALRSRLPACTKPKDAQVFLGVRAVCYVNSWFALRVGNVLSVSSRRITSKDRSLENSGCACVSVRSAENRLGGVVVATRARLIIFCATFEA